MRLPRSKQITRDNNSKIKVVSRESTTLPLVKNGGDARPLHQNHATIGHKTYYTIPASPIFPVSALSNSSICFYDLEPGECDLIQNACFRLKVKNNGSSNIVVAPLFYWLKYMKIWAQKGTGDEITRLYPIDWIKYFYSMPNEEQRKYLETISGFSSADCGDSYKCWYSEKDTLAPGEERFYYLPMEVCNFIKERAIDMGHISNDLRFEFNFTNPVITGTASDLQLNNVELIVESHKENEGERRERLRRFNSNPHKYIYLDTEKLMYNDKTLSQGQNMRFTLETFYGKFPFFNVVFKNGTNPIISDKTDMNFLELGKNFYVDVEDVSGNSLLGEGTPLRENEILYPEIDDSGLKSVKGLYSINFNESCMKSMNGSVNGFLECSGQKNGIVFNFGDSGTDLSYDIQSSVADGATPASTFKGYFKLNINGICSPYINPADTPAVQLVAANKNPWLMDRNISIKTMETVDGVNDCEIVFDSKDADIQDEIKSISLDGIVFGVNGSGADNRKEFGALTRPTTKGKRGWTSGSSYTTEIYGCKFKEICVSTDGRLSCQDL